LLIKLFKNKNRKKFQVNLQMINEQSSNIFQIMLNQPDISDRLTNIQFINQQLEENHSSNDLINQFTKKILNGKQPTLVSIGNLRNMPFIQDFKA
jgi:hypothetical protein